MCISDQNIRVFTNEECKFGYRDSYFKNEGKGKYIITSITLKLTKRNHKLNTSYPKELGNSGSFFKNPILTKKEFNEFIEAHPEAKFYKVSDNEYKVPAGWLIEQCGYKGKRFGDAGVHKNQALVLVNFGNATGQEIYDLAYKIMDSVFEKYGIHINPEVNIIK